MARSVPAEWCATVRSRQSQFTAGAFLKRTYHRALLNNRRTFARFFKVRLRLVVGLSSANWRGLRHSPYRWMMFASAHLSLSPPIPWSRVTLPVRFRLLEMARLLLQGSCRGGDAPRFTIHRGVRPAAALFQPRMVSMIYHRLYSVFGFSRSASAIIHVRRRQTPWLARFTVSRCGASSLIARIR